jgi:hypothetical protein
MTKIKSELNRSMILEEKHGSLQSDLWQLTKTWMWHQEMRCGHMTMKWTNEEVPRGNWTHE